MPITKELKHLEKSNVQLSVTVPKEDVRTGYNNLIKEYSKNMILPGFRKGKVPQEVLERKFGDALKADAMGHIIEDALKGIFTEEGLSRNERPLPYCSPELQGEPALDFEKDLQFSVIYDVLPQVKVGQWQGLKVDYPYAEVEKDDINRELENIRERNAIVMDRDDSAKAQKDDVVTIDYKIFEENGEVKQDMQRNDFTFTLGSGSSVFKFDDDVTGMKKGDTKEFEKKFQDDHAEPSLAGKKRKVEIKLLALKEKKLPALDDDLAQDVDEKYKTLDDLKNHIKERLDKNLEFRLRDKKLNELLKKIMENTPVIIPESMLKTEVEGRLRRLARYYNTDPEMLMKMMDDERTKEWRDTAAIALHSRLIIETLMEEQKIEITDEDVENEFKSIADASGAEVGEVKKHYDDKAVLNLKEDIREKKITDILLSQNTLKPGKKENYLDFMSDNG